MKRLLLALALALASTATLAQSVQQSGSVTAGHVPRWVTNGVIGDGGTAADSPITSLGVTSNSTSGFCISSGRVTAAGRQQMCFGAPLADSAVISLQNYGTATEQALKFVINGVEYSFPGSLSGIVVGTTPITGGGNGLCLYDNNGVVGAQSCSSSAITQLTGDVSATGPGVVAATLATVNVNVGTFGSGTQVPVITVDGKGRITAASNTTLTAAAGSLSGTTLAANVVNSSLTSVGALASGSLASGFTVVTGAIGGTGVANTGKTITLGGSLTTSGAFDSTFTMTGATNVTFPTSGTLATTAGANVSTVSNSDGTLTISPTSGAVIASLALGHANTWTAQQTFTNNLVAVLGSSTGYTTFASANSSATNYTATFPANDGTVAELNLAQSWTATQTLQTILAGTTNTYDIGTNASTAAFRTIYAGTSFVGPLVNATTGYQVNGAATSGQYLRGNGTNFVSSAVQGADLPFASDTSGSPSATQGAVKCDGTTTTCLSGVVSAIGGAATDVNVGVTTVTGGTSTYLLYNNAGVLGNQTIASALGSRTTLPTTQTFSSGSGTYTTPANVLWIEVQLVGGGGGGHGSGTSGGGAAGNGGDTCWNTSGSACTNPVYGAGGGVAAGALGENGGAGGSVSGSGTPYFGVSGGSGGGGATPGASGYNGGGSGGNTCLGGGGGGGGQTTGIAGTTNTGGGGGGGGSAGAGVVSGSGGGGGACVKFIINNPSATYTYAVGAAGTAGTAGTNGAAGGAGGSGIITVIEHYGS